MISDQQDDKTMMMMCRTLSFEFIGTMCNTQLFAIIVSHRTDSICLQCSRRSKSVWPSMVWPHARQVVCRRASTTPDLGTGVCYVDANTSLTSTRVLQPPQRDLRHVELAIYDVKKTTSLCGAREQRHSVHFNISNWLHICSDWISVSEQNLLVRSCAAKNLLSD